MENFLKELTRNFLIDLSLKERNKELFMEVTSANWNPREGIDREIDEHMFISVEKKEVLFLDEINGVNEEEEQFEKDMREYAKNKYKL